MTDANLVLGRLDPDYFLGGAMRLDADLARRAVARVGEPLGVDPVQAAAAIVDIAVTSMVHAVNLVTTQRGYDVRDFALVAFGGAGPLHANALAAELDIRRTIIPPSPGIFSALGLLVSDVEHDYLVSALGRFGELDHERVNATFAELETRGHAALALDGIPAERMAFVRSMDVRYVGQSFQLRIDVPEGLFGLEAEAAVRDHFHAEHERAYGYAAHGEPIELVNLRLTAIGHTPKPAARRLDPQRGEPTPRAHRQVHFGDAGFVDCPVYDRYQLGADARILGPAIVDELDSTTVLYPEYQATVGTDGSLLIEDR